MGDPYLKINRRMLDELIEGTPKRLRIPMRHVWFHILLEADFVGKNRGQLWTGIAKLSAETGYGTKTIRNLFKHLERGKQGASKVTNKGRVFVVVNYDGWVCSESEGGNQKGKQGATTEVKKQKEHVLPTGVEDHEHKKAMALFADIAPKIGLTDKAGFGWYGKMCQAYGYPECGSILKKVYAQNKKFETSDQAYRYLGAAFNGDSERKELAEVPPGPNLQDVARQLDAQS